MLVVVIVGWYCSTVVVFISVGASVGCSVEIGKSVECISVGASVGCSVEIGKSVETSVISVDSIALSS